MVLEGDAIQDVLVVGKGLEEAESQARKQRQDRMAAVLSRLGERGDGVVDSGTVLDARRAILVGEWRGTSIAP